MQMGECVVINNHLDPELRIFLIESSFGNSTIYVILVDYCEETISNFC